MKLSKLYTNKPKVFTPIEFVAGVNVVMAETHLDENQKVDVHNLGKSTLGRLIDFCFLSSRSADFFLFKHQEKFIDFVFFLEIELANGSFVTVRRNVATPTRIAFKTHINKYQDFNSLSEESWSHRDVAFENARVLLDGILGWSALGRWNYRKIVGYLLRSQSDYLDVFQLAKNSRSKHSYWKPFLAHILGFDGNLLDAMYKKGEEVDDKKEAQKILVREFGAELDDAGKIDSLLILKREEVAKKEEFLESFNFREPDRLQTEQLVDELDESISSKNTAQYRYMSDLKKIKNSLEEDKISFNPDEAERLFSDAGILFDGQIKKDFQQLIEFNLEISTERERYLVAERNEIIKALDEVSIELQDLGKRRADILSYLQGSDSFDKFRSLSKELISLKSNIEELERRAKFNRQQRDAASEIKLATGEFDELVNKVEDDRASQLTGEKDNIISNTIRFLNDIMEKVIHKDALLSVTTNSKGNLEFEATIQGIAKNKSDADKGTTYKKLLCIAFDMAILRSHLPHNFPRFVFHDGILETMEDRTKQRIIDVTRSYADDGIQSIITLVDSDLPSNHSDETPTFSDEEIILTLHDEGPDGRLFKMAEW